MQGMNKNIHLRLIKLINVFMITAPFAACWFLYYSKMHDHQFGIHGNTALILLYIFFYVFFARVYDAFLISYNRISEMIYSQVLSAAVADGFIYIVICLICAKCVNILPGFACLLTQLCMAVFWSLVFHKWYFFRFSAKVSAIIYDNEDHFLEMRQEYELVKKFDVQKTFSVEECLRDLSVLDDVEVVFLSDLHSHDRNIILKYCVEHYITVFVIPRIGDMIMSGARRMHMFHLPILRVGRYNPNPEYIILKRIIDFSVSGLAVLILSPILIITAIAIKSYDHGPVFYKQRRLTQNGKIFNVLKFRSMRTDAEANGVARLSSGENDPRITPVGRFIRKCRIDELPQLFNILEGSMSLVGPRPERPEIAEVYEKEFPEFRLRLQAKAGLTGYAQVYGKYNTTPYNKLRMDLMYIANPSLLEDMKICFATVKILFIPESTEGVAVGQTTAMKSSEKNNNSMKDKENA